jgi:alpha-tubulin suppressor-like RCC1 family protein
MALADDGTVYTWGRNDVGQLGNSTSGDRCRGLRLRSAVALDAPNVP